MCVIWSFSEICKRAKNYFLVIIESGQKNESSVVDHQYIITALLSEITDIHHTRYFPISSSNRASTPYCALW